MNIKNFKSGHYIQRLEYKSFSPSLVNHEWVWDDAKINTLLEEATRALGELNAFSLIAPDIDLFIQMHITKEANTSSRIEGTQTQMGEAVRPKNLISPEKRDDWQEVHNYIKAMNTSIKELARLPLSNRLLKTTHQILMSGVRGEHKEPGEFRRSQNWIGGASLKDAVFIPPTHEELPELASDLEKFWHNESIDVPHLIRIAISHYQFETIHPFLDGNGRVGRLLITLYLVSKGLLHKPSLYLSDHFEKHKSAYYDSLMLVRTSNDLGHWLRFFLVAVLETAKKGKKTFQAILSLKDEVEHKLLSLGRKANRAHKLLTLLYRQPFVTVNTVAAHLDSTHQAANALIRDFERLGILKETTGFQRNRLFHFHKYFKLFID